MNEVVKEPQNVDEFLSSIKNLNREGRLVAIQNRLERNQKLFATQAEIMAQIEKEEKRKYAQWGFH